MKEKLALFNRGSDGDISPSNNKLRTTPTKSKETPSPPRSPPPPPVVTPPSPKQQPKPVSPSNNIIKSNVSFNKIDSNTTTNTNSAADSKSGDTFEDDQEFKSIISEKQTIIDNNREQKGRRLSKAQMQFASALDKTLADGPPPSPAARRKSRLSLEQDDDNINNINSNNSNGLGVIPPPPPQKRDSKSTPPTEAPPRSGTPTTSMETDSIDKSEEDNKALAHVSLSLFLPLLHPLPSY